MTHPTIINHPEVKIIPPNPEVLKIINRILDQNEVILKQLCPNYVIDYSPAPAPDLEDKIVMDESFGMIKIPESYVPNYDDESQS